MDDATLFEIFTTPIYATKLNIDLDRLIQLADDEGYKEPIGRKVSNIGGYQTSNLDYNKYKFLFDEIFPHTEQYLKIFNYKSHVTLHLENFWINVNRYRDFNILHHHLAPGSTDFLNGVLYLKTPQNCGNIIFEHPFGFIDSFYATQHIEPNKYIQQSVNQVPEEKLLLIIPSYLKHFVEPNMSQEDRISLAFNMSIKYDSVNRSNNGNI